MEAPGGEPTHPHTGWVGDLWSPELERFEFDEVLEAEALLLGRVTYESFAGAWPGYEGDFADRMNAMAKLVVSSTLGGPVTGCHPHPAGRRAGPDRGEDGSVAAPKTRPTDGDVTAFLDSVPDDRRRAEAHALRALFERATGAPAVLWGPSIVGFGRRPYTNTTGTHEWFAVGFSPRKQALAVYGALDGDAGAGPLLDALGPHTTGKGCLYLKRLDRVDLGVLEQLVRRAWDGGGDAS